MRATIALCVLLCGCEYNYYGAVIDGGVTDMPGYTDDYGEYHDEGGSSIFKPQSKLQGNARLQLQPSPALPATLIWPYVDPVGGSQLLDVYTADELPHVMTVSLGRFGSPLGLAGSPNSEAVAVCEVGIGGFSFTNVEIDFIEGVMFSIAASRFSLNAVYRELPGVVAPVGANVIQVGASLANGVIAHGRSPQRTLTSFAGLAPGVGNEYWRVPKFAKSFRVIARPNTAIIGVDLVSVGGADAGQYNVVAYPSVDFPVPSDAHSIRVINSGPVAVVSYSLIFELAL